LLLFHQELAKTKTKTHPLKHLAYILMLCSTIAYSQSLDYETITKSKPIKVSGQVAANGVYYNSDVNTSRLPFTYFLQGALNINIYSFAIPISYSYSNQGENIDYQLPFDFNRISLHPKYKWITGHIGTVNMTFSPYTLSGHQFTGGGVDLTPSGPLKISAMAGRLLRATEDDEDIRTIPAYNRMGYGIKTNYEKDRYSLGIIGFYAKDDQFSIDAVPEAKEVFPKENLVVSLEGNVKLGSSFNLQAEYAATAITQDTRAEEVNNEGLSPLSGFFTNRASTEYYNALKARLGYAIGSVNMGLSYERIDPGYETLGAYFFNNDFENIVLDASNTFFKNKLTLALNIGYQRDDLDNLKANNTNRTVGSLNATFVASDRLNIAGSYSNFSTFTNVEPNQFDEINDADLLDEQIEDLNYRQLSQTATLTFNYLLSKKENARQNLITNYSLNDVFNEQGGVVRLGDASTFHNLNLSHTIDFIERNLNISTAVNATYNTIGREESSTWGPTLSLGKRYFDKTLNTRLSAGYNVSNSATATAEVINLRGSVTYTLKKQHNFNLNAIQVFRNTDNTGHLGEITATFGYNYAFGLKKPNFQRRENNTLNFSYRKHTFEGLPYEITSQLQTVAKEKQASEMAQQKKQELKVLARAVKKSENKPKKIYKEAALDYLKALFYYEDFLDKYDEWIYIAYLKLIQEGEQINSEINQEYTTLKAKVNTYKEEEDIEKLKVIEQKFESHTDMLISIKKWNLTPEEIRNPKGELKKLKDRYLRKIYTMYQDEVPENKIINYIEVRLADLYHNVLKKE